MRKRDQRRTFQCIKSLQIETTRKEGLQYIYDEERRLLRYSGLIFGRWVPFFGVPIDSKPEKLDPSIVDGIPKRSITLSLGAEQTKEDITVALRSI